MEWLLYYAIVAALFVFAIHALAAYVEGDPDTGRAIIASLIWPVLVAVFLGLIFGDVLKQLTDRRTAE